MGNFHILPINDILAKNLKTAQNKRKAAKIIDFNGFFCVTDKLVTDKLKRIDYDKQNSLVEVKGYTKLLKE